MGKTPKGQMVPISPVYRGRFGIESDRVKSGNRCRIDVESTSEEGTGEADSKVRCGGFVPNKPFTVLLEHMCRGFAKGVGGKGFSLICSDLF